MADTKRVSFDTQDQLIERIRTGDIDAFEYLYHTYYDGLSTFAARYFRSWDEAIEIVQDVFLRLWINRGTWTVRSSIQSYLYGAVRNAALNAVEHRRVVERSEQGAAVDLEHPWPNLSLEADDDRRQLAQALTTLTERQRAAIALRYQELSYEEVGDALGISHVAARKLVLAGEERLRNIFGRETNGR